MVYLLLDSQNDWITGPVIGVRQIIGWREYKRGVYRQFGRRRRTGNYWQHTQPIPASFYDGTTGIVPDL